MKNNLFIAEKFYSIQGEGQTMGIPAVFIRLSGCNILCQSENWVCDTIEVWRKGVKTPFEDVLTQEMRDALSWGAHLIFTGGEPLLHQEAIFNFITWLAQENDLVPKIEIETNGTIMPCDDLLVVVDYWNVSPKLTNSGVTFKDRYNDAALETLSEQVGSIFKFVVSDDKDLHEIFENYDVPRGKIWLMPAGSSRDELKVNRKLAAMMAIKSHVRFSDRLHIGIWNQKTGV